MYEVLLARQAEKDLKRLPGEVFHRVIPKIKSLAHIPRPVGCRKLIGSQADWRIREGDDRVVYQIDDHAKVVRVMRVRHRREAYR